MLELALDLLLAVTKFSAITVTIAAISAPTIPAMIMRLGLRATRLSATCKPGGDILPPPGVRIPALQPRRRQRGQCRAKAAIEPYLGERD